MKTSFCRSLAAIASALAIASAPAAHGKPADGRKTFVLWDPLVRTPAMAYRLDDGWRAKGWIRWDAAARRNQYSASVILFNPETRQIAQESTPFVGEQFVLNGQTAAIWQDAGLMAKVWAEKFNNSVAIDGLGGFTAKGGRFTGEVSSKTRGEAAKLTEAMKNTRGLSHMMFKVECFFDCVYRGVKCEAKFESEVLFFVSQPMPNLSAIAWDNNFEVRLTIAPAGKLEETARVAGRMFAGAFVDSRWLYARDRMMLAIAAGRQIGADEGWKLMKQAQRDTEATMARVRKGQSEVIREVKTVDNPFSPGDKFERTIHFDRAWLNSAQDTLLLSDASLEPGTIRGLMEKGDWKPVD